MVLVEEQDYYYSDSDSDDEDVDRYVFLARQPAPAGRHAEDDPDASSVNDHRDDDGDGTAGDEESGGGVRRKKKAMPLREILVDDAPPPPPKKARLEPIIAPPLAKTPPSGSESALACSPCGVRSGESGNEGSHVHNHRVPREEGEAKNMKKKKRAERTRGPACEVDGDRDSRLDDVPAAAKTGTSSGGTSGRFHCSLCDRCFDSHQALGGHVLGHQKKRKIAIAAAACLDAAVEVSEDSADGRQAKDAVTARPGKANGDGNSDEEKAVTKHGDEDVDRARHRRKRKVHGKDGGGFAKPLFVGSHDADANGNDGFDNKCSPVAVSGHCFTHGNSRSEGKMDIGTACPNRKVVAGTCREGTNGNGNGNGSGSVCRARYKCKVCGTECLTGRALGGHMRKHRKQPRLGGGGGEERPSSPATDEDSQIHLARVRSCSKPRDNKIPGLIE